MEKFTIPAGKRKGDVSHRKQYTPQELRALEAFIAKLARKHGVNPYGKGV